MAETYQKTTRRVIPTQDSDIEVQETSLEHREENTGALKAQQIVQFISGFIATLLSIRFVLALFGANSRNAVVSLLYDLTAPLVAPFRSLFTRPDLEAVARFEVETLVAIIAYLLLGVLIVKLIDLFKSN